MTSQNPLRRDSMPNRSMALIRFRRSEEATEFVEAYNGKPFNSMDVSALVILKGSHLKPVLSPRHATLSAFYLWRSRMMTLCLRRYSDWAPHRP